VRLNGWENTITPDQLCERSELERYAALVQVDVSGKGKCPMRWVEECWGTGFKYSTKRSAFWRGVRNVVQGLGLADVSKPGWASHLVWSNLYKVSLAGGGNPSQVLKEIQLPGCAELLDLEFRTYQPSRVLFLTGDDWATPFMEAAALQEHLGRTYVKRAGTVRGTRFVVVVHPQGKPGAAWAREVIDAFER